MNESELVKRVDDLLRLELLHLGWEYAETIDRIEETSRGELVMVHFHGPHPAIELARPEREVDDAAFAAIIRRRLKVALEGPPPFAEPIDDGES